MHFADKPKKHEQVKSPRENKSYNVWQISLHSLVKAIEWGVMMAFSGGWQSLLAVISPVTDGNDGQTQQSM